MLKCFTSRKSATNNDETFCLHVRVICRHGFESSQLLRGAYKQRRGNV